VPNVLELFWKWAWEGGSGWCRCSSKKRDMKGTNEGGWAQAPECCRNCGVLERGIQESTCRATGCTMQYK